ncbi:MAG: amidohydrolase family protein [Bryobacteraceae bacterium]|nr:amidohydrolase family protein [Bryobacteraceae bacterium]
MRKMRLILSLALCAAAWGGEKDSFLLRNATIHPVSGPAIQNASLLVIDGKIAEIGPKVAPRGKVKVIDARGLHVYPGLIDSGSPVGLAEIASIRETVDTGEIGDFNPQLRALIAINPSSEHIPVVRANGITTVLVTPGTTGGARGSTSGGLIAGQASLVHLDGWTWEEMEIRRGAAMQMTWPVIQTGRGGGPDLEGLIPGLAPRRVTFAEARRNQQMQVQKIQDFFDAARRYQKAKTAGEAIAPDLRYEAMIPVLDGRLPLMITAAREREIREALEFAARERVRVVLAGVRRPGKTLDEIAKRNIPVVLGTPFVTPLEEDDAYDEPFTLAAQLHKAGVKFCFASFNVQFARNLPFQAGQAAAFGLPYDEALKSVTLNAAEIWGVADQYGSIDKGKYADLIVTDGDPLEIRTQIRMMFIKGVPVDLESKHTRLYRRYMARP